MRDLFDQHSAVIACQIRNVGVRIFDDPFQARHITDPLGCDMAELIQMRPERINGFGALLDELLARPECDGTGLLFGQFRFDETHGRPQRRLDDRLCIGGVILLALQERLDVMRRDQPASCP
jgi:hypothetical protein